MSSDSIAAGLATVALVCMCASAGASTHIVDQSGAGDFLTVQAAVDAAANRDTIVIRAGTYSENIVCVGKCLTYIGEGSGVTTIVAAVDAPSVGIQDMPSSPGVSAFSLISIHAHALSGMAVHWYRGRVSLRECEVLGQVKGGRSYPDSDDGTVSIFNSDVTYVEVTGGYCTSIIENSHIDSAFFHGMFAFDPQSGASWCEEHWLETSSSVLAHLSLGCTASIQSQGDAIGALVGGTGSACQAAESTFESIELGSGDLQLQTCLVSGPVDVDAFAGSPDYASWDLIIEDTLVEGDFLVEYDVYSDNATCEVHLCHNTIIGDVFTDFDMDYWSGVYTYRVRGNIVQGYTTLDGDPDWWELITISHNDFVGGFTACAPPDSIYANISEPPLFCGATAGDYSLQDCSPCVGAAHDGGDIGAFGVGCSCNSLVEETTWGRVKAMFRQPSN